MQEVEVEHVCLAHNIKWRAKYHHIINKVRGQIRPEHLKRIPQIICTCKNSRDQQKVQEVLQSRWAQIPEESFLAAKEYFEHYIKEQDPCEEFHGFLKLFFQKLVQDKLLDDNQPGSSARRFLYVIEQLLKHGRCSLMDPILTNPRDEHIYKEIVQLPRLRPEDVGNFIGRKGSNLRKLTVKGSKVDIIVNHGNKSVEAHIVCKPESASSLRKSLQTAAKSVREGRDRHEEAVAKYYREREERARGAGPVPNDDDDEDDDDEDDDEFQECED